MIDYSPFAIALLSLLAFPSWLGRQRIAALRLHAGQKAAVLRYNERSGKVEQCVRLMAFSGTYAAVHVIGAVLRAPHQVPRTIVAAVFAVMVAYTIIAVLVAMWLLRWFSDAGDDDLAGEHARILGGRVEIGRFLTGLSIMASLAPAAIKYYADCALAVTK